MSLLPGKVLFVVVLDVIVVVPLGILSFNPETPGTGIWCIVEARQVSLLHFRVMLGFR